MTAVPSLHQLAEALGGQIRQGRVICRAPDGSSFCVVPHKAALLGAMIDEAEHRDAALPFFHERMRALLSGEPLPPPPPTAPAAPEDLGPRVSLRLVEEAPKAAANQNRPPEADLLVGWRFDGSAEPSPPAGLVKGLIPNQGVAFIGGQSGAGKSFIVVDLAVALATGGQFFGRRVTERVGVAILAAEGASTFDRRLEVARTHRGVDPGLPIAWLGEVPDLAKDEAVAAMVPRLQALDRFFRDKHEVRLGAVVFDTLSATFGMDDENRAAEAAAIVRKIRRIGDATGAVMLPVHHAGKTPGTGLRGTSVWRANCDAVIGVDAQRDETTGEVTKRGLSIAKARDGVEGPLAAFALRFVALGIDEDGEEWGSCFVEPLAEPGITPVARRDRGLPPAAKTYLDSIKAIIGDMGSKVRPFLDGPEVTAVDREHIRAEFYRRWPADGETEKQRAATRRQRFASGERAALDRQLVASRLVGAATLVWMLGP